MRSVGTQAIGVRTPIIREGDPLPEMVVSSVLASCEELGVPLRDRDIIGVTEAVVARAQGNYATVAQIAADVREKFQSGTVGVVFPILSRNRFATQYKGIAAGAEKVIVQLSYPSDEVGNHIVRLDEVLDKGVNPYADVFDENDFRARFPDVVHEFTGVDYLKLYRELGGGARVILANDPCEILKHTNQVIAADIHTRDATKKRLRAGGANVYGLDEILTKSVAGSGWNENYGLLGANKSTEDRVKLFPRDCDAFVHTVQALFLEKTGVNVEVLIYGDGAFKDPIGKIWELADPVVSPAFTEGLAGLPNELKLKYLADNQFADKKGEDARAAIVASIRSKTLNLMGKDESLGTTPRYYSDLIGSLCDLVSGSGDKGTPVVLIRGYFDNLASE
ncbi:MAG: coenzyme F420-0:L-glutamate ligase [Oscillospiraceae bacterium]|jgi:F420-0:gamma-glutamyl ligase|nr:coenzyme F420-0:L-glutamate ligase [Oscillospiraceae bacterium]